MPATQAAGAMAGIVAGSTADIVVVAVTGSIGVQSKPMIIGRQICETRLLLKFTEAKLAERAKVSTATIARAEAADGEPPITIAQAAAIRRALEKAGVEFVGGDDGEPGARLEKGEPNPSS